MIEGEKRKKTLMALQNPKLVQYFRWLHSDRQKEYFAVSNGDMITYTLLI